MTQTDDPRDIVRETLPVIENFGRWLDGYGETSFDHQSYYAGKVGNFAKRMYYKVPGAGLFFVAPMVVSEAFFPWGRALFHGKQRLPIADAHYAMGFSYMFRVTGKEAYYKRALHFLEVLLDTKCPAYTNLGWGYPFDWETRLGNIPRFTPLITTTPYVFEAFKEIYLVDNDKKWLEILRSIAQGAYQDYIDYPVSSGGNSCSYSPHGGGGVINASAYRGWLLTSASHLFPGEKFEECAQKNLQFVIENQDSTGLWPYSADGQRDFIDHYHTCFVLKALLKVDILNGQVRYSEPIKRGLDYYLENLFDEGGLPKPYSRAPRLTVYKNELYDYAECINLCALARKQYPKMAACLETVLNDLSSRWIKRDGSFRSRKLLIGWDNVPMHRWAQSQTFRALAFLLASEEVPLENLL